MKRLFKALSFILGITMIISCTTENEISTSSFKNQMQNNEKVLVIKERDSRYPLEFPQRNKTRSTMTSPKASSPEYDLSSTYKLDYFPLGTAQNLGIPTIDIKKLKESPHSIYIDTKNIGIQTAEAFSYTAFDRYTHKSKETEKISHGANLDLKLFSIGNKGTIEKIYTTEVANENNRAYGQLDIEIIGQKHILATSSNSLNNIKLNYLHPTFRDELYSLTMGEFIKQYGALILTNFYTGGRVTAIYSGIYSSNELTETKEKNIEESINASYGSKKDTTSGGGSFGIGRNYFDETKMTKKFTNMSLSVKAIGGNLSFPTFSSPQGITQVNIDLSGWMASMNSPSSYRMIDIEPGGLHPLSDFVLEANIERHIRVYLAQGDLGAMEIQEPYIEILRREIQGITLLITSLVTKNEDRVSLDIKNVSKVSESQKLEYIKEIANEKSKVYGLRIIQRTHISDTDGIGPINFFDMAFYNENLFFKYIDTENDTMYLLYKGSKAKSSKTIGDRKDFIKNILHSTKAETEDKNGVLISVPDEEGKYGLSIYKYKRTLNLYGLTDFVAKLPTININKEDLLDYMIVSL